MDKDQLISLLGVELEEAWRCSNHIKFIITREGKNVSDLKYYLE